MVLPIGRWLSHSVVGRFPLPDIQGYCESLLNQLSSLSVIDFTLLARRDISF
jgi:hypothetical protein